MPPKVENIAILIAKRDIAIASLDELYGEFNMLYQVELELIALENVYKEIAIRFQSVKKQQTTIAERLIKSGETEKAEMNANKQIGDQVKSDYFKCSGRFIVYKKKCYAEKKPSIVHEKLEAMTCAVTKMADVLRVIFSENRESEDSHEKSIFLLIRQNIPFSELIQGKIA